MLFFSANSYHHTKAWDFSWHIVINLDFKYTELQHFKVFDSIGKYLGFVSGYSEQDAATYMKLRPGLYIMFGKSKSTVIVK